MAVKRARMLAFGLLLSFSCSSWAGLVKLSVDANSEARVEWTTDDGETKSDTAKDTNGDKLIEFAIPDQGHIKGGIGTFTLRVKKKSDGRDLNYSLLIPIGGSVLASLEPFDLPTFTSVDPSRTLLAVIDITPFRVEAASFMVGDVLTVTNGGIDESTNILFRDATGVPDDPFLLLDQSFVAGLPLFDEPILVGEFDTFRLIPEAGALPLVLIGLVASLCLRSMRKRQ